ncbi:MAG: hypothetical protein R3E01_35885 [Pirellulaceae bacterium]|nr:hypothetical protein [Planctomycetales bacterium]
MTVVADHPHLMTHDPRRSPRFLANCAGVLLAMIAACLPTDVAAAQENGPRGVDQTRSIEDARRAFRDLGSFPWYDADSEELRPVEPPQRTPAPNPSSWEVQPNRGKGFNPNLGWLIQGIAYLLLAVLLLFVIWLMYMALRDKFLQQDRRSGPQDLEPEHATRIENLPFDLRRPTTDLLGEAERLYAAGHYGEAMVYLYSYQLVHLDKNHLIRLARGKTNRQYLRELRRRVELRFLLEVTMVAFEDFFFGNHPIDRKRFEQSWNQLEQFHQRVAEGSHQTEVATA